MPSSAHEVFQAYRSALSQAKYGSFLILPLKYDREDLAEDRLERVCRRRPLTTMDLNENIKGMLDPEAPAAVGSRWAVPREVLVSGLCGGDTDRFLVSREGGPAAVFDVGESWLYIFHTRVAFLCLRVTYDSPDTLRAICNPGFAENPSRFSRAAGDGTLHPFSLEEGLARLCGSFGLRKFFDGCSSFLLEAYAYNLALLPRRFQTLELLRKLTFSLHQMAPLDAPMEDDSEADVRYVYAVKNRDAGSYRWGCCVSSQTVSYAVADEAMDFAAEMAAQAEDGLPVAVLALYQKYTCLRFTELIACQDKRQLKRLRELKNLLLEFQAYGTVTPANLSRWHNVKQIYASMLEVCDIPAAIRDISTKLNILAEHQQELERGRNEAVINIITTFGVVSILASVLTIVQILSGGNSLIWGSTVLTAAGLALVTWIALRVRK